jgi:hypothetical protein
VVERSSGDDQRNRDPSHIRRIQHSDQLHTVLVSAQGRSAKGEGKSIADPRSSIYDYAEESPNVNAAGGKGKAPPGPGLRWPSMRVN